MTDLAATANRETDPQSLILASGAWTDADARNHLFDPGLATALALWFKDFAGEIVDLGCGAGDYVKTIRLNCPGVDIDGLDGNPHTRELSGNHPDVHVYDLTNGDASALKADWILCLEVGEHVPVEHEEAVWRHLACARVGVVLSWATPQQTGHGHVNPQPPEYIGQRMEALGYVEASAGIFRQKAKLPWFRDNLRVFLRPEQGEMGNWLNAAGSRLKIYLGMPHSGNPIMAAAKALWTARSKRADVLPRSHQTSALCRNFNLLWAEALNLAEKGLITHFAMLHDDCIPADGWLDVLLGELDLCSADLVAACPAIKDDRGLLSTAIEDPLAAPWDVAKRLTTAELQRLPETFDAADCGYPGRAMLANTGCWLCDLRRPVFHETGPVQPLFFTMRDNIVRDPGNGEWIVRFQPEDWLFSHLVQQRGGKVVCTRKVVVGHVGQQVWPNNVAWGRLEEDDCGTVAALKALAQRYAAVREGNPT